MSSSAWSIIAWFWVAGVARGIDWTRYSLNAVIMWTNKYMPHEPHFESQRTNWEVRYPGSIQTEIMQRHARRGDGMDLLAQIVRERSEKLPAKDRPQENTVTVHLRLGDVLDSPKLNAETDVWHQGSTPSPWHHTVYTKGTLAYFLALVPKIPPAVTTAYVVGSFNHTMYDKNDPSWHNHTVSVTYRNNVVAFFRERNFTVVEFFERTPDEDIIFMGTSKYFILSGGSFTHNMARLCARLGGRVIYPPGPPPRKKRLVVGPNVRRKQHQHQQQQQQRNFQQPREQTL